MKLSTLVKLSAKILSSGIILNIYAEEPAIISVINQNDFYIKDRTNNSEISRFKISIFSNPRKSSNGSLEFQLKITTNFQNSIKYKNKKIEDSENGKIFTVIIPKEKLKNKPFRKKINLKSDDSNYKFQKIKLKIEPCVSISADTKEVNFGKISCDGHFLFAKNSPRVKLTYSILKDAICEVFSENNFQLKHENKNDFIHYSMNNIIENGDITLSSDANEYIANFKIQNYGIKKCPLAGNYFDRITFTIKTDK